MTTFRKAAAAIRKTATSMLVAVMVLSPTLSLAADGYTYFRMYGRGSATPGGPPLPPPQSVLAYQISGSATATVGQAYAATSTVTGALAPVVFTLRAGSLPPGVTLDPATGKVAGVPSQAGVFAATIGARDSANAEGLAALNVTVSAAMAVTGSPAPAGTVGIGYAAQFSATGGSAPYVFSTVSSLPPGLTLSAAGLLSGTPSLAGDYPSIVIHAVDAAGIGADSGAFAIKVGAPVAASWTPAAGQVGVAYVPALPSVSGGRAPYHYSLVGPAPNGLSFDGTTGALAGTPALEGGFDVSITAVDADGRFASTGTKTISIAPGTIVNNPGPLVLSANPPSSAQVGIAYTAHFAASGGSQAGYVYSLDAGTLPTGLALDPATGVLSGSPTAVGTASGLRVRVTDSASSTALYGPFSIAVEPAPTLIVAGNPSSFAQIGQSYVASFTAFDGTGAGYTFSSVGAALPPGLVLADVGGTGGQISGQPLTVGTYSGLKIRVTDSGGNVAETSAFTITVTPPAGPAIALNGSVPAYVGAGQGYSATLTASGGTGTGYVFSLASGALPSGLTLSASGTISGVPAEGGASAFTAQVTDSAGDVAQQTFTTTVVTVAALASGVVRSGHSHGVAVQTNLPSPTWTFTQTEPASPATGYAFADAISVWGGAAPQVSAPTNFSGYAIATQGDFSARASYQFIVNPDLTISYAGPTSGLVGTSLVEPAPAATGILGIPNFRVYQNDRIVRMWDICPGLSIDETTGVISGTPLQACSLPDLSIVLTDTYDNYAVATAHFRLDVFDNSVSFAMATPSEVRSGAPVAGSLSTGLSTPVWSLSQTPSAPDLGLTLSGANFAGVAPQVSSPTTFSVVAVATSGAQTGTGTVQVIVDPAVAVSGGPSGTQPGRVGDTFAATAAPTVSNVFGTASFALLKDGATYGSIGSDCPGLVFSTASGTVSGTPSTTCELAGLSIRATDSYDGAGATTSSSFGISIAPGLAISGGPSGFLTGTAGTAVAASPAPSVVNLRGTPTFGLLKVSTPYTSLTADCGLVFDAATGVISGIPTKGCNMSGMAIEVVDGFDGRRAATTSYFGISITGASAAVTLTSAGELRSGRAVTGTLSTNLPSPVWTFNDGGAFGFVVSGGSFSGIAPAVSSRTIFGFAVTASANGVSAAGSIGMFVDPALAISGGPSGTVTNVTGAALPTTPAPTVSGVLGTASYGLLKNGSGYAIGTDCPGLSFSAATGQISGTPTASCSVSGLTLRVVDSQDGVSAATTAPFAVAATAGTATASLTSPSVIRSGAVISGAMSTNVASPTWSFPQSPVSPSLALAGSGSTFSGTAPSVQSQTAFSFSAQASGSGGASATSPSMSLTVHPPLSISGGPTVTQVNVAGGSGQAPTPTAAGVIGAAAFALLKNGTPYATLSSDCPGAVFATGTGTISGFPFTGACTVSGLTIRVTDSADGSTATTTTPFGIKIDPVLTISGTAPSAMVGAAYSFTPTVAGGSGTYPTFTLANSSGTLAALGLGFDPSSGKISGTPTATGSWSGTIQVADSDNNVKTASFSVAVNAALAISGTPAGGVTGTAYSFAPTVSGGSGAYSSFALATTTGALPAGLSFSSASGAIAGTPTATGTWTGTISVTDSQGHVATSAPLTVAVSGGLSLAGTPASAARGASYSFNLTTLTSGGASPYSYSLASGVLPAGMSLASGGLVSATNVTGTTSSVTISVTDAASRSTSASLTFNVMSASGAQVIVLTSGTSWTVPSDWNNAVNTIEAIGGGAGGGGSQGLSSLYGATGGGGGEYRKLTNVTLTPGASIPIQIGQAGAGGSTGNGNVGQAGTATKFNTTALVANGGQGGSPASMASTNPGGAGGSGGSGGTGFSGGQGGSRTTTSGGAGAGLGGGGAAGPNGPGGKGGDNTGQNGPGGSGGGGSGGGGSGIGGAQGGQLGTGGGSGGPGGAGGANSAGVAGGAGGTSAGTGGTAGTDGSGGGGGGGMAGTGTVGGGGAGGVGVSDWPGIGGAGGGGGGGAANGGTVAGIGGIGGFYGGGGGGAGVSAGGGAIGGGGRQGVLVITYTPYTLRTPTAVSTTFTYTGCGACSSGGNVNETANQSKLYDGNDASNAADPSSLNAGTMAAYDLGASYAIVRARLVTGSYYGFTNATTFAIQYSDAGLSGPWTSVGATIAANAGTGQVATATFAAVGAHRYWRIANPTVTGGNGWLGELGFYTSP